MLTREQAKKLSEKALSFSTFPECELRIDCLERASIRFAVNGVTTSGFTIEQGVTITSERDGKSGATTLAEFDDQCLREDGKFTERLAAASPAHPDSYEAG